jgi:hypothetical protein
MVMATPTLRNRPPAVAQRGRDAGCSATPPTSAPPPTVHPSGIATTMSLILMRLATEEESMDETPDFQCQVRSTAAVSHVITNSFLACRLVDGRAVAGP